MKQILLIQIKIMKTKNLLIIVTLLEFAFIYSVSNKNTTMYIDKLYTSSIGLLLEKAYTIYETSIGNYI
jgi:hypothetical protein